MRIFRKTLRKACMLTLFAAPFALAHAASGNADIALTDIRAIRISATTISLTFNTKSDTIGQVAYHDTDGATVTLTDSVAQGSHLFTIDELDADHGYTFLLTATAGKRTSNTYSLLLSAANIGSLGQSIVPAITEIGDNGKTVSTTPASVTLPAASPRLPYWLVPAVVVLLAIIGGLQYYLRRQKPV